MKVITSLLYVNVVNGFLSLKVSNFKWDAYKKSYNKVYDPKEDALRYLIYKENINLIKTHNINFAAGTVSYQLKTNQFVDMTAKEVAETRNGYQSSPDSGDGNWTQSSKEYNLASSGMTSSVDWRTSGVVGDVQDQGVCASCWAFSAAGVLESRSAIMTEKLTNLSKQNLVDCSGGEYGNSGCNGGDMRKAFKYIAAEGIQSESSYPYNAQVGQCRFDKSKSEVKITGYRSTPSGDERALQRAVSSGPVAAGICGGLETFVFYGSGIYYDEKCSSTNLDHGVIIVGYGTEDGKDFWIVKNSWGATWGEQGYIRIARNSGNACGIATAASYPVLF